ncbi:MAG TPA: hypothetical protein VII76_13295 [Acidimicrobiales bacterium]
MADSMQNETSGPITLEVMADPNFEMIEGDRIVSMEPAGSATIRESRAQVQVRRRAARKANVRRRVRRIVGSGLGACVVAGVVLALMGSSAFPCSRSRLKVVPVWTMAASSANNLQSAHARQRVLNQPNVLLAGSSPLTSSPVPRAWVSIAEERWTSEAQFAADIAAHTVPTFVRVVHYDDEVWAETPLNEQQRPGLYMKQFCELAHQHHWLCATGPSRDICSVAYPSFRGSLSQCYLTNDLAGQAAKYADYTDFQGQALEPDGTKPYAQFIAAASAEAKAANPFIIALGNLSPTPNGATISARTLNAEARAVYPSSVGGFYMTITTAGARTAARFFSLFEPRRPRLAQCR